MFENTTQYSQPDYSLLAVLLSRRKLAEGCGVKTPPASLHVYPSFLVYLLLYSQLVDLKRCSHMAPLSSTLVLGKTGQMG